MDAVPRSDNVVVGVRQSKRLIEKGMVQSAYIAKDADSYVSAPVVALCKKLGVKITYLDSKKELGKACNIDVDASVAVVLKD